VPSDRRRPRPHVGQALAGTAAAVLRRADTVVGQRQLQLPPVDRTGLQLDRIGTRMPHHVGDGLEHDALHLQRDLRRDLGHRLQRRHVPAHHQPGRLQARLQAVAQHGEHRHQVALQRLQRVDHHAHLVERLHHVRLQHGGVGIEPPHQAQQAHQLRAHAIVELAHDALALVAHGALHRGAVHHSTHHHDHAAPV
jgi:hypothetical protein